MADNILFSTDPAGDLAGFLRERGHSKICVVTDEHTVVHCYPELAASLPPHQRVTLPAGEAHKNLDTCARLWQAFTDQALDRRSVVVVVGGGVLGDMAGFCAATYKRGIDFILVPTTLLAQVDASIGGKLGVDFNHFKNHIGVFQHPALTLLHAGFLKTLPEAELRSGFAEIVKHTLIADASMWNEIRGREFAEQDWEKLIHHSVQVKKRIVADDPREKGLRKVLNAGHTLGHAIETHMLNMGNHILHGEAVAAGLICEAAIAMDRGLLTREHGQEISDYLNANFPRINLPENDDEVIAALTVQDKKNQGNKILCVLLEGPGKARWDCEISLDEVKGALSSYRTTQT